MYTRRNAHCDMGTATVRLHTTAATGNNNNNKIIIVIMLSHRVSVCVGTPAPEPCVLHTPPPGSPPGYKFAVRNKLIYKILRVTIYSPVARMCGMRTCVHVVCGPGD